MPTRHRLILASASPRRRSLLQDAGYAIEVDPSGIDEPEPDGPVDPRDYASVLAWRKARSVAARRRSGLILAADTVCAVEGVLLNKPEDRDAAERMIRLQEERDVKVVTAFVLYRAYHDDWLGAVETSVVRMRRLSDAERDAYLDSGLWEGKAGAYGVQDDDPIISVESGSWSNVVGLPLERLATLLNTVGPEWADNA